jgi:succinoglycan biosynthesis transport protein ExoP
MSVASSSVRPLRGQFIDADFDLPVLGAALWRNRLKILRPTLVVALLTFVVVLFIPPKYLSESRVLVVGRDNVYLRADADKDTLDRGGVDAEAVTSQAQLILSRDLAVEVINKLQLAERPEFDPALGGMSLMRTLLGFVGLVKNPVGLTPEERALDAYYDRLNVYPVEKSRVIVIDFLSEDPELSARVANAIADAYLQRQQLAKQEQARSAGAWLSGEIDSMRKKVADAEAKVEQFRAKSNLLVGPNGTTLSAQQLGDLNAQLAAARTLKADAGAKSKLIREMLKSGDPIDSSDVLNSELIRRLSEQRVTLRAQLAEQSSSLLENHPRIKELRAQIDDLDKQIRHEADNVARSLENDAKLADARVEAQMATFDQFKGQAATTNEQDVQLRALERDAKSQRDLLESYLAKYREASARDTIASAPPDARVISRAMVSSVPAYPKKFATVLIATLATLLLCSGMVVTREFLANPAIGAAGGALRGPRPVNAAAAAAAAARVGQAPAATESLAARLAAVVKGPRPVGVPVSAIEEFAHNLHRAGDTGSQIAFFGGAPQLDTSGIAIKFARSLAKDGRAVLVGLGSGDSAIKEISGDPSAAGLAELGAGTASFGDIITKDNASGLNLILSGRAPANRSALLAAPGTAKSFQALAMTYAHVVIDAGALDGADMAAIAALAPHAILLVETLSNLATDKARERLEDAGFDDVTILVAGRPDAATSGATTAKPATAATAVA